MSETAQPPYRRIAVVTVSYGSEGVLPGFLEGFSSAIPEGLRVIVADNDAGSDSGVRRIVESAGAEYLPLGANRGYGGAVNETVASLSSEIDWVLVSNPDVTIDASILPTLITTGESDAKIGSVGPVVLTAEGEVYPSAREVPSIRVGIGHALFSNLWPDNPWTRSYKRSDDVVVKRDAGWLSGSCVLVRRTAFDELGGFDTGFFMYFEDVDLGYRLTKAGYRNVFEPAVSVVHTGAHSTRTNQAAMVAAHHDSARRFIAKKYPGWMLAPVRWTVGVGLAVRSWVATRRSS
jgi:N-acetylglucosaminyl-diphospho-decaprenol L-rhamnosyltransferase